MISQDERFKLYHIRMTTNSMSFHCIQQFKITAHTLNLDSRYAYVMLHVSWILRKIFSDMIGTSHFIFFRNVQFPTSLRFGGEVHLCLKPL